MSNIEFDADQTIPQRVFMNQQQNRASGMAGWLLKKGIIQEESQARGVLIGIVVINFAVMAFVIYYFVL